MCEDSENSVETFFKNFSGSTFLGKEFGEFGERVHSYIVEQKWVRRPLVLSPAVCARFGWKCINYNLLECVTCSAKICTPELKIEICDVYNACIEKILKELKTGHKTHCPWPLTPCPESFVKMIPMPKEEALKPFLQRLNSSLEFSAAFPQIKNTTLSQLGLNEEQIFALCKLAEINSEDSKNFGMSAVNMAATGWTVILKEEKEAKIYITCKSCQRSIWSGSFNSCTISRDPNKDASTSQNGNSGSNTIEDSPSSRAKRFKRDDFDPLEEHRPWCLWITTDSSRQSLNEINNSEGKKEVENSKIPGWKIFIKSLLRNVNEVEEGKSGTTPSREQIRSVRNLLETWTDPVE